VLLFPRLRTVLVAYVAAVAFTRVMFGAHFPLDVVAGTALGIAGALLVGVAVERLQGRSREASAVDPLPDDATLVAVMPSYNDVPTAELVDSTLAGVDRLVIVDDGSEPDVASALDAFAGERVQVVHLPRRGGKGSAVRAGVERIREEADAVLVIDADAQHPAEAIPTFVAAAREAELVIGDRFDDLRAMPPHRRVANRATRRLFQLRTGDQVRDTQNGMRLIRGRALDLLPGGGFEAETRHLRRALDADVAVAWVPIPAIYGDGRSSFRTGRDSLRVLWATVQ
jgi:dolichol-phosphate mannosyltransferase